MKGTVALAAALAILAAPATAAIYRIDFSFPTIGTPDPATGSVTIDNEFNADVPGKVEDLTVEALNFVVDGPFGGVAFQYDLASDRLDIGGVMNGPGGITIGTNDFRVTIDGFLNGTPATALALLTQTQQPGFIAVDAPVDLTITKDPVDPPVIPLPATLPLALAGLGLLGLMRRRHA